jgi:hypothetical protein
LADALEGLGALEFFAGDLFDGMGIGLQRFHFLAQLNIFGIEAVDVFANSLNFILGAAHGDKSMGSKDVVNDQREDEQAQNGTAVQLEKFVEPALRRFLRYASTHLVASSVKRADAFGLSAST